MSLNVRQLQAFVAVFEEGSFNKAARRLNATQSGLSTLVGNLEAQIGLRVFERTTKGIEPTQAGERLYRRSAAILRDLGDAETELRMLGGEVAGRVRVGLIPAFTYSLLAPALAEFFDRHPAVDVTIIEAYSPSLVEGVGRREFDFAIVPAELVTRGIGSTFFGRDRELLVAGRSSPMKHGRPVQLNTLPPLRLILPTHGNARRERLEAYFAANGVRIEKVVEMDAMLPVLELVAERDFMTIIPTIFLSGALRAGAHKMHPITAPDLTVDYLVIEPRGQVLSLAARLLLETLQRHFSQTVGRKRPKSGESGRR